MNMKKEELIKDISATDAFNLATDILNKSQAYLVIGTINVDEVKVRHDLSIDGSRWGDLNMLKEYRRVLDETIKEWEL